MKGETVIDKKTKERVPKKSLMMMSVEEYLHHKATAPDTYRSTYNLDHLENCTNYPC